MDFIIDIFMLMFWLKNGFLNDSKLWVSHWLYTIIFIFQHEQFILNKPRVVKRQIFIQRSLLLNIVVITNVQNELDSH